MLEPLRSSKVIIFICCCLVCGSGKNRGCLCRAFNAICAFSLVKCYFALAALLLLLRNYYIKNSREPKISYTGYLLASFVYPSFFSLSPMMSQNPRKTVCCSKVIKEERSQEIHLAKYCIQKLLFSNTYSLT